MNRLDPRKYALPPFADCCLSEFDSEDSADVTRAYTLLLQLEAENSNTDRPRTNLLLSTRILGQLLISFAQFRRTFGHTPLCALARTILSESQRPEAVSQDQSQLEPESIDLGERIESLGTFYRENFLRVFRQSAPDRPRQPWFPPSRPCFDTVQDLAEHYLHSESNSDFEAARMQMLLRDGFRCILTGHYDLSSARACREVMRAVHDTADACLVSTECCHLLDASFLPDDQTDERTTSSQARSVAAVLDTFGLGDLLSLANSTARYGVNSLENMFLMRTDAHRSFDYLAFWFEPTETEHQYTLAGEPLVLTGFNLRPGDIVVFRDHSSSKELPLPLPDPRLLALHATCARAVHLTGVEEYFIRWDAEEEHTGPVLASDGSSANLLEERLGRVVATLETT